MPSCCCGSRALLSICHPEPSWRVLVLRLGENEHILSIVMHHIMYDAWSIEGLPARAGNLLCCCTTRPRSLVSSRTPAYTVSRLCLVAEARGAGCRAKSAARVLEAAAGWQPTGHPLCVISFGRPHSPAQQASLNSPLKVRFTRTLSSSAEPTG